jgi:hypothetical protein
MAEIELMEALPSPTRFLHAMGVPLPIRAELEELESWWEAEGKAISAMIDRMGTPWLRAYDRFGHRIDEILYPPDYRRMLLQGYRAGAVWRAFEGEGLAATFLIGLGLTQLAGRDPHIWRVIGQNTPYMAVRMTQLGPNCVTPTDM